MFSRSMLCKGDHKFAFAIVIFQTDKTRIVKIECKRQTSQWQRLQWYGMLTKQYACFICQVFVVVVFVLFILAYIFYWFLQHFLFSFCLLFHCLLAIRILLCVSSRSDLRHGTSWRMAQPACSWDFVCGRLSSWVHPLYSIGIIVFLLYLFFHSWWWLECTCQLLWQWKKVLHHVFKKTIMVFFF